MKFLCFIIQRSLTDVYKDPLTQIAKHSRMKFDAELGAQSIYKGTPRIDLDEAWKRIVDSNLFPITQE